MIAAATGLDYRPVKEGMRVSGTYRQSLTLVSGRFALLDDGLAFSLVPWKPVIEGRLGRMISAEVRGANVQWYVGHSRGLAR